LSIFEKVNMFFPTGIRTTILCSLLTVPTVLAGFTFGYIYINIIYNFFSNYCTTPVLLGVLHEVLRSKSDTPHSVQLLYINDRSVAEKTTWQHAALTRDRHPCFLWDSIPQSKLANRHKPTIRNARPMGSETHIKFLYIDVQLA
jgi:hypothetical protein